MSKTDKLLTELLIISYANMIFNTLLSKLAVAALLSSAGSSETYDKEVENAYKAIDEYANKLHKEMEDNDDKT
jgi:hypothetical protein